MSDANGPGAKLLTINANSTNRVFHITDVSVSLSGLTIANGYGDIGGGILSVATYPPLKIEKCIFRNNRARVTGGALQSASTAFIADSAFLENSAADGGGAVYALDGAAITNSTFLGNSASNTTTGVGGAIYSGNLGGNLFVYSCTVVSNTATASTSSSDSNPANDSSTVTTTISASADVSIVKSGPATATAGNTTPTFVR